MLQSGVRLPENAEGSSGQQGSLVARALPLRHADGACASASSSLGWLQRRCHPQQLLSPRSGSHSHLGATAGGSSISSCSYSQGPAVAGMAPAAALGLARGRSGRACMAVAAVSSSSVASASTAGPVHIHSPALLRNTLPASGAFLQVLLAGSNNSCATTPNRNHARMRVL